MRRGVYLPEVVWAGMDERSRGLVRIAALAAVSGEPPIFTHWSAALLLDLPVPFDAMERVHRVVPAGSVPHQPGVVTHRLPIAESNVMVVAGLRATTVARTACDIAAAEPFEVAVAVADAALRLLGHGTESGRLLLAGAWDDDRRGSNKVAAVTGFADALAETPIESRSRVTIRRLGLPAPVLQQDFADRDGFVARVDFWLPDRGGIGEADGAVKLLDPRITNGDPGRALLEEKRREDRLRLLAPHLARWGWREAISTALLGRRLAAAGILR